MRGKKHNIRRKNLSEHCEEPNLSTHSWCRGLTLVEGECFHNWTTESKRNASLSLMVYLLQMLFDSFAWSHLLSSSEKFVLRLENTLLGPGSVIFAVNQNAFESSSNFLPLILLTRCLAVPCSTF